MRIAQIAPLWETIPPRSYGGTELVVQLLTEALVALGHEVTLFAAGGSTTSAKLEAITPGPLRDMPNWLDKPGFDANGSLYPGSTLSSFYDLRMLDQVFNNADQFDVIHNHLGFMALPFANMTNTPVVTTLHGAFKDDSIIAYCETQFFSEYAHLPYVSISNDQRRGNPDLNYVGTVYHGLDMPKYEANLNYADKNYLAFLGRFCPEKGPHHAIRIANETGWPLILAGKVDAPEEKAFFEAEIAPHIDGDRIRYIGELNHPQKVELLKNAAAALCPVTWPEPFGLVLIEAMACGTPVFAMRHGSIPELVRHGLTGFVTDTVDELIAHIADLPQIDRRVCRDHIATNFSNHAMASHYVEIFERLSSVPRPAILPTAPPPKVAVLSPKDRLVLPTESAG